MKDYPEGYTEIVKLIEIALKSGNPRAIVWANSFLKKFPANKLARPIKDIMTNAPPRVVLLGETDTPPISLDAYTNQILTDLRRQADVVVPDLENRIVQFVYCVNALLKVHEGTLPADLAKSAINVARRLFDENRSFADKEILSNVSERQQPNISEKTDDLPF